jgi:hypothetical protein
MIPMKPRRPAGRRVPLWLLAGLLAGALGLAARPAEARLIDLHAGVVAGGLTGWGSDSHTPDFFSKTNGAAFGAEVGLKLLMFDLSIRFLQVADSRGLTGTLATAMLGFEIDVPISEVAHADGSKSQIILRPGFAGGIGFGTPAPVQTPYNNAQISDKGLLAQGKLALDYNIFALLSVGVEADFGYHYFLGGNDLTADMQSHSSGVQLAGLGTFTFHLGY